MIVADIVRRSAPSVREHTVLTVAADALVESGLGSLPVLDADGLLTGVVSEGDLLRFVVGTRHEPAGSPRTVPAAYRQDANRHVVADVMTRNPVTATERLPSRRSPGCSSGCRGGCCRWSGSAGWSAWSPAPTSSTHSSARAAPPAGGEPGRPTRTSA